MKYITINCDRYSGAYSSAFYTAWGGDPPEEISSGDTTCSDFWENNNIVCGKGDSPDAAIRSYLDLTGEWIGAYDIVEIENAPSIETRFLRVHAKEFVEVFPNLR